MLTVVMTVSGPLCRDVDGVVLTMKAQLVPLMHELDSHVPPLPFNNEVCVSVSLVFNNSFFIIIIFCSANSATDFFLSLYNTRET